MRSIKNLALTACLALSAVSTAPLLGSGQAQAQGPRPFRDSWFWGGFGGLTSYTAANTIDATAPGTAATALQLGGDWLITRKTGGLYLSFAQAFLTSQGAVINGPTSADTGFRYVDVKNLRRLNLAAMAFPGDYVRLHPYIGFGIAFDYLGAAQPQFSATDTQRQEDFALSAVSEVKAALGPLFLAGAQYRVLNAVSAFGQFTASAMSKDFLLSNGNPIAIGFQAGLRYNIGSSIEREY
jgi:hypothetical protein